MQGATVVEEHEIAGPEGVAHLELVGAGELAESAQGRIRTRLVSDRHVGETTHGMKGANGERHAGGAMVDQRA